MFRSRTLALLFAAFVNLAAWQAEAQMAQTGAGKFPAAAPSYTGPGDIVASAKSWYGLRAYDATHADGTHVAVKLIRALDTHNCQILLTTSGGLGNTTSCSTSGDNGTPVDMWCNATTCAVDIWYDQAGTDNVTAAGGSASPTITFSCIGALPCLTFTSTTYLASGATSTSQPLTVSAVAIRTGTFTSQNDILSGASGAFFPNSANQYGGYFGGLVGVTASDSAWHSLTDVVNGATSTVNVDGTASTGLDFGTNALPANWFIGAQSSSPSSPLTGDIAEVGLWASAFTGTQQTNVCHNQFTYWGTSVSC